MTVSPDPGSGSVIARLIGGAITGRVVVVVAHPDDETVSLGGLLPLLSRLTLVHVTNGAPEDMGDADRLGFETRGAYRDARARELDGALTELGVTARRVGYGIADQASVDHLPALVRQLSAELDGAVVVITHAYEGGHPDHDSCAFAVQTACAMLSKAGRGAPVRVEFPSYHQADGRRVVGRFLPDPSRPEHVQRLTGTELAAKHRALACHGSQAEVLAWFDQPEVERLRVAPDSDFTRPPPSGEALYDGWGWGLTSAVWRARAADALNALEPRT